MRHLIRAMALAAFAVLTPPAVADEAMEAEILEAFEAITEAFELQDASAIEALTTKDHVAITSYYGGPMDLKEQIATASDFILTQKPISKIVVQPIGPDVAVVRFIAEMHGSFKGEPIPSKAAVTMIWQRQDGKWLERLYQETPLAD